MGISCDHVYAHQAWATSMGGLPYPCLGDWHPKGNMSADYGVWNEERGAPNRAVIVVDKQGIIRFRRIYEAGVLPDPNEILEIIEGLG